MAIISAVEPTHTSADRNRKGMRAHNNKKWCNEAINSIAITFLRANAYLKDEEIEK